MPRAHSAPHRGRTAIVIGAGPNGLAAAIVLAQAGLAVEVFEAEPTLGGACRTMDLTLPGFHHDFGSAVHPLAAGSPFFASLPLAQHGLEWIHPLAPLAHPLDDGTAVMLERSLTDTQRSLGPDGDSWRRLIEPFATHWNDLAADALQPLARLPRHPLLMARFGLNALLPAATVARRRFRSGRTRALFAGLAAHSFLQMEDPLSASFAMLLGAAAHAVGWPIPRGGAQAIPNALAGYLISLGGRITTSTRIERLDDLPPSDLILCDITPRQLLALDRNNRLTPSYGSQLTKFRYAPGVFKVDYALSQPIPWHASDCLRAATVHLGGSLAEISASESAVAAGRISDRPFVLLSQPTLFDPTRAPAGKHIAWAYCHIPNAASRSASQSQAEIQADTEATLTRLENQIERYATGFRDTILARHISTPATLESRDANLIGGDIMGGAFDLRQSLFRPTRRAYATSAPNLYLCSASTPPGGGVHGMPGANAARQALRNLNS